jgi:hypothetical protein
MGFFDGIVSAVAGPIIGGLFGKEGQDSANEQNVDLSREQMAFQERMSNTAHQREVKDLIAAGLNPMLSAKLGGASTPVGSLAHVENSNDAAIRGATSALSGRLVQSQIDVQDTQADINRAMVDKVKMDTRLSMFSALQADTQSNVNQAMTEKIRTEVDKLFVDTDLSRSQVEKVKAEITNIIQSTDLTKANVTAQEIRNILLSNDIPQSVALSDFYKSVFGREVAPYLNSASSVMDLGKGALGVGVSLKHLFSGAASHFLKGSLK